MRINIKGAVIPNDYKIVYDFFGMESVCPRDVNAALEKANGDSVEVYINSGGGYIFAGQEIYNALATYAGPCEIKIVGLAASAASMIAMARHCLISPVSQMMIHNVYSEAEGDYRAMHHAGDVLDSASEALANAYAIKSKKPVDEIRAMMDAETWLTADKALAAGLVDGIIPIAAVAAVTAEVLPEAVVQKTLAQMRDQSADALEQAKTDFEKLKRSGL